MKNQIITDLLSDKIVTIPTETVEGYAVSLNSEPAIRKLMKLKDRNFNSDKIFTLIPEDKTKIGKYCIISKAATRLVGDHIPGELTLILPKNPNFHHFYYDHYDTIGIRIPDHPLFQEILPQTGPLILTSANSRGGTPKSTTGHLPSTIIDFTSKNPKILRQGNLVINL